MNRRRYLRAVGTAATVTVATLGGCAAPGNEPTASDGGALGTETGETTNGSTNETS